MCFDMRPIKLDLLDLSSGARPEVELDAPEFIVGRGKRVFVECVCNVVFVGPTMRIANMKVSRKQVKLSVRVVQQQAGTRGVVVTLTPLGDVDVCAAVPHSRICFPLCCGPQTRRERICEHQQLGRPSQRRASPNGRVCILSAACCIPLSD